MNSRQNQSKSIQYWLFVDSKTRVVSKRLTQRGAEEFISNLKNINLEHWWAWNPCFRDWIPLKNIIQTKKGQVRMLIELLHIEMDIDDDKTIVESMEPESSTSNVESESSDSTMIPKEYSDVRGYLSEEDADMVMRDFHGDDLTMSSVPTPPDLDFGSERRRSKRYDKKIEVLIIGGGKSFRTHTLNISMSGLMLDKAIPFELQSGPFEVVFVIVDNGVKRQIAFQGKVVGDLRDRRRLIFGELSQLNQKVLAELFAA